MFSVQKRFSMGKHKLGLGTTECPVSMYRDIAHITTYSPVRATTIYS
jgi:hypothetical protein